jgi:hypothetical protein
MCGAAASESGLSINRYGDAAYSDHDYKILQGKQS